jgi:hypothetical protein
MTSKEKRERKAEVANVQSQAKIAWAALGGILVLVVAVIVYMSSAKGA